MYRRTKIIATLGPGVDDNPQCLENMLLAGVNLVRLNFSHGDVAMHKRCVDIVRECAKRLGLQIGIIADLQGPKIRIGEFKTGKILLESGDQFTLDTALAADAGMQSKVGISYTELPNDVKPGNILMIDDGRLRLEVQAVTATEVVCVVIHGGELSSNKGVNLYGGGLAVDCLTEKDQQDLQAAIAFGVDYVALSFVRGPEDIVRVRNLMQDTPGKYIGLIAKIERSEAVEVIDAIIESADGIMVARGDLAVEIGEEEVPAVQKLMIKRCRQLNKPVITATQMMESMVHCTVPTRAEVSDVANAVLDGSDAVMLSAETAVGDHPELVIEAMVRICLSAEKYSTDSVIPGYSIAKRQFDRVDEAIAVASMFIANRMDIKAIIALTESGATPLWMSRIRSGIPIYALSRHTRTCGRMTLYRDVYPVAFDVTSIPSTDVNQAAIVTLKSQGLLQSGDLIILTKGDTMGIHGQSNAMKILEVE